MAEGGGRRAESDGSFDLPGSGVILVAAVGQRRRGDDALGGWVLDALERESAAGVALLDLTGAGPAGLLDRLEGRAGVIVVDAMQAMGGRVGEVLDLDGRVPRELGLLEERAASTHTLALGRQLELAAALGLLPARVRVIGAVVGATGWGTESSAAVRLAVARVTGRVLRWVERWGREIAGEAGPGFLAESGAGESGLGGRP